MGFATVLFRCSVFLLLLVQLFSAAAATGGSYSRVKYLPGFSGPLPFELETGYVGVGDSDQFQIFHYFIKSDANPKTDPLIIWLTGGPGCSALSGLAFAIGPISFKEEPYNDSIPELLLNPYSWTKKSSIIFVDLPAGTGFSYDTTSSAFKPGDFSQIHHYLQFLRKWLVDHPEFITNPFYVGGDSYSGMIVPVVAQKIVGGNTLEFPIINFQGYILGNPYTIRGSGDNFAIPFAHRMTLISEELFESLKTSCKGKYVNIDPTNVECLKHYKIYKECISNVEPACILDPKCPFQSPKQQDIYDRRSLNSIPNLLINQNSSLSFRRCPEYKYKLSNDWANTDQVWKALHVREGSIEEWIRCKNRKDYTFEIESVFSYHVKLSSKGYRSLIYSGDHDMLVPHLDTQTWIKALNYSIVDDWRPWFILDQVAGYTRHYANNMTFATIKGGGHTAEYTRRECSIMFSRWISGESL
ncbi:serine carboxypeptidase-like 13 isoform X2 [Benincasa hispida]|uniref:serine carboxypeptidase-like 13 isoform X2 n=1 Tax=Benincasa hispida TaxID=102211 RepID=UPI0019029F9E|nr:serine carboxypeptidase-like 13 isoform X2 [Benincasa hispida]